MANDILVSSGNAVTAPSRLAMMENTLGRDMAEGVAGMKINRISINKRRYTLLRGGEIIGVNKSADLNVIIVAAQRDHSRTYYIKGYSEEGPKGRPDCYSNNGVTPANDAPHRQSNSCQTCKQNKKGSAANGEGKACAFKKRLIVVPADSFSPGKSPEPFIFDANGKSMFGDGDPEENLYSLGGYISFLNQRRGNWPNGVPAYALVTRITFNNEESVPCVLFGPGMDKGENVAWLDDDASLAAHDYSTSPEVKALLALSENDTIDAEGGETSTKPATNNQSNVTMTKPANAAPTDTAQFDAWVTEQIEDGTIDAGNYDMVVALGGINHPNGRKLWEKLIALDIPSFEEPAAAPADLVAWVAGLLADGTIDVDTFGMVKALGGLSTENGRNLWAKLVKIPIPGAGAAPAAPAGPARVHWEEFAAGSNVDNDDIEMIKMLGGLDNEKGRAYWTKVVKLEIPAHVDLGAAPGKVAAPPEEVKPKATRSSRKKAEAPAPAAAADGQNAFAAQGTAAPAAPAPAAAEGATGRGAALAQAFANFDDA